MSRVTETSQSAPSTAELFSVVLSPLAFRAPETFRPISTWHEHIPFAFWLMEQARPRVLVELGTFTGTSYLAFCQAIQALELSTRCYGVDRWLYDTKDPEPDKVYRELVDYHDSRYASFSKLIRGTFDEALDEVEEGTVDLLHIDGGHDYESVRHDFESWRPKLSSRAVVLFHDSNVYGHMLGELYGVHKLWADLTETYPDNFEFFHGAGLAVLGVGNDLPTTIRRFFALARDAKAAALIRNIYARLGSHCTATVAQLFVKDFLQDSLAVQRVPGEYEGKFDNSCGARAAVHWHQMRLRR